MSGHKSLTRASHHKLTDVKIVLNNWELTCIYCPTQDPYKCLHPQEICWKEWLCNLKTEHWVGVGATILRITGATQIHVTWLERGILQNKIPRYIRDLTFFNVNYFFVSDRFSAIERIFCSFLLLRMSGWSVSIASQKM